MGVSVWALDLAQLVSLHTKQLRAFCTCYLIKCLGLFMELFTPKRLIAPSGIFTCAGHQDKCQGIPIRFVGFARSARAIAAQCFSSLFLPKNTFKSVKDSLTCAPNYFAKLRNSGDPGCCCWKIRSSSIYFLSCFWLNHSSPCIIDLSIFFSFQHQHKAGHRSLLPLSTCSPSVSRRD